MWAVLEARFYALGDAVVVELEVIVGWCLRHGWHTDGLIGTAEGRVDTVVGRQKGLAGLHEVAKVLLLVGVKIEIVRHAGCLVGVIVNHGENAKRWTAKPVEGGVEESGCALFTSSQQKQSMVLIQ